MELADETRCDDASTTIDASALRFDAGTIGKLERTPVGGVRVPARVTRSGVLEYRRQDGTTSREWRPPEEVFAADSLASLADAAVTVGHPVAGRVTPESFRADAVGYVREAGRADGRFVATMLAVQEAGAISRIDAGELVELSCGYRCTVERKTGVTPDGERYDAIQRGIRYNHVALLPKGGGRAGREVALRVDGASIEITEPSTAQSDGVHARAERNDHMKTERIDGIDYEIGTAAWTQARERHDAKVRADVEAADKRAKEAEAKATAETARADAAEKRIRELEGELAPAKIDVRVSQRAALIERVRPVVGADAKLDGKSDIEVMVAALTKLDPEFKADSIDATQRETYVRARFEAEMRHAAKTLSPSGAARADAFSTVPSGGGAKVDLSAYRVKPGDRI